MKYVNDKVRRQDRLLEEEKALIVLRCGEYGVLSMIDDTENSAYGVPVNFVWDGATSIYIHCAPEGRKLRCIALNSNVSFCIVGNTNVISKKFTTEYESVVLRCTANVGLPVDERKHALELILKKYSLQDMSVGLKYAEKSFFRTEIIRLDIIEYSGKCKKVV